MRCSLFPFRVCLIADAAEEVKHLFSSSDAQSCALALCWLSSSFDTHVEGSYGDGAHSLEKLGVFAPCLMSVLYSWSPLGSFIEVCIAVDNIALCQPHSLYANQLNISLGSQHILGNLLSWLCHGQLKGSACASAIPPYWGLWWGQWSYLFLNL